ncbi:MAG: hydantoinase/oxoprolinase family protein [Planctomycetes bacterium]|nr:hydantoinase/oxoprolinase family protein [Planctomycetota bacterium]MBI3843856.1 hydantoinase/oxoprolinase family protein [Planctomycetota bacterium]
MRTIGIDTGGTFTDFVFVDGGGLRVLKVPSTPDDPSRALKDGLTRLRAMAGVEVLHGSTVATNALLERRGARTALVTTEGFRDVLEIGRQDRPRLYDLEVTRPEPLVPRALRLEARERTLGDGSIHRPLSEVEARRIARRIRRLGCESAAVCLISSFANPRHERALGRALRREGVPTSLSHEVLPEYREFERTSTTVADAYLTPVVGRYLARLEGSLGPRAFVMQSNGGLVSFREAASRAVATVFSGPAAGVVGAIAIARASGFRDVLTLDVGGTSADVSLARGDPRTTNEFTIAGVPIRIPVLDIHTVGAGGGSIAWIDEGGALRVGPRSAGASPGPACYGRGTEPTVTDANVALGRIPPNRFLGGTMPLRAERAVHAISTLARRARLTRERAALGVLTVVETTMERALKVISLERGFDPRDFTLVAFGGAGPLHAAALAASLGCERVLVPPDPGALAARGLLGAAVVRDASQTVLMPERRATTAALRAGYAVLERSAASAVRRQGFTASAIVIERWLDVRYEGQSFEISVPFESEFRARFDALHAQRYGHADRARPIEVVTLRVRASARRARPIPPLRLPISTRRPSAIARTRALVGNRRVAMPVYDRATLGARTRLRGPLVVTEYSATTFVPPEHRLRVDRTGSLLIEIQGA